jgi:hypothetical protein
MTKRPRHRREDGAAQRAAPSAFKDVEERAARLGVTPERVLEEMRRIAFSDLSRIAEWHAGEDGLRVKPSKELDEADAAAVAEIVASASTGRIYRIKLHDKTPGLVVIARCIDMFPRATAHNEDETIEDDVESAREQLIMELDRLSAEMDAGQGVPEAVENDGPEFKQ